MDYCKRFCVVLVGVLFLNLETIFGQTTTNSSPHICIIGAGYSGLGTAKYMQQYGLTNIKVYEATRHIGGTWRFDPHVGTDEDGLPLFTSMYKNLRTNTPRQTMEYSGYQFPENTSSYVTGECFYKYLKSFAKHFGLKKYIQHRSLVTSVKWDKYQWNVTYVRTDTRDEYTDVCDFVAVANGFYRLPKWPKFEGEKLFKGNIIHSHDYKDAELYRNRRVLLVGAGPSGLDLSTQLVNVTSKLVHSHHLQYNQPNYPKHYIKKPDIERITADGAIFNDGSFEEIDDMIFCTGFDFDHPFLDKSTGITATREYVLPLYQHVVNIRHPSMVFVGISKGVINKVLDVQAEYAALLATQKFKLPTQEQMLKNWLDQVHSLQTKRQKIIDVNRIGDVMDQYFANMTQEAKIKRVPPVITKIRDHNAKIRLEDILHYREYDYQVLDDQRYDRKHNPREEYCPFNDTDL